MSFLIGFGIGAVVGAVTLSVFCMFYAAHEGWALDDVGETAALEDAIEDARRTNAAVRQWFEANHAE